MSYGGTGNRCQYFLSVDSSEIAHSQIGKANFQVLLENVLPIILVRGRP